MIQKTITQKQKTNHYLSYIFITENILTEIREAVKYSSKRYVARRVFGYSGQSGGSMINKMFEHNQQRMRESHYAKLKEFLKEERAKQET